jgi:hypothetical protein
VVPGVVSVGAAVTVVLPVGAVPEIGGWGTTLFLPLGGTREAGSSFSAAASASVPPDVVPASVVPDAVPVVPVPVVSVPALDPPGPRPLP